MTTGDEFNDLVCPITPCFGAFVDVDLRTIDDVSQCWLRGVLDRFLLGVFRRQHLSPGEHVAFARAFGVPRCPPASLPTLRADGWPEVTVLDSAAGFRADSWHTDEPYTANPPEYAVLVMRTLPPNGGDTIWTDQCAALDALSAPVRAMLDGLTATQRSPNGDVHVHPVIRRHRRTGRRALYVNEAFTTRVEELSPAESERLLRALYAHCRRPEFSIRHRWSEGDVVVWNNWCTQHNARFDFLPAQRVVHSVDVAAPTDGACLS